MSEIALAHFPFWYAGSFAIPTPSWNENSRRLKPAARNTEKRNALDTDRHDGTSPR